jgi:RNA polymerase sigma factor (sigma-70 family)
MADHMESLLRSLRKAACLPEGSPLTDGELLEHFLTRRDEMAMEIIIHRHSRMVWGVCRRMLRQQQDAEDAFQATFLVLVRRAASIEPKQMVGNWLYGVAHQTARKARAMRAKRWARERQGDGQPDPIAVPQDSCQDLLPLLDDELSRLPDKYRVPIILCDFQGKTRKEVASQLHWPEGTVAGRLARAREILAKRLTRRGVSLSVGSLAALLIEQIASASVPGPLLASTIKGVVSSRIGQVGAGLISAAAFAITEGVVHTMVLKKSSAIMFTVSMFAVTCVLGVLVAKEFGQEKEPEANKANLLAEGNDDLKPGNAKPDRKADLKYAPAGSDNLVRAFLGISSIHSRFIPPVGGKWFVLAIAKFDDGKLAGYVDPGAPLGTFSSEGNPFQAELGWGPKEGSFGYFVALPWASTAFRRDDFFRTLSVIHHLTDNKAPEAKLGPFHVLGYAHDGKGVPPKDSTFDPLDVRRHIQARSKVVALLLCPFETAEQARMFLESPPKLVVE